MLRNKNSSRYIFRMSSDAMLIAVYVVLSLIAIPFGGLKFTLEHLPVVFCAVAFGPLDALLVGGIGELFNQLTSFGITPTTGLWVLPILFRGLFMGLCAKLWTKRVSPMAITQKKLPVIFIGMCIISGILSSCLNTFAYYVDSKMFGYYSKALVFGQLTVRLLLSALTSIIIAWSIKPILHALRKARFI